VSNANQIRSGILITVACYFLFSIHDASIKWLLTQSQTSIWLIFLTRSVTILILCILFKGRAGLRAVRETRLKAALTLRGAMILCAWLCFYTAARTLQLAELVTLYFAAPIIITLLAVPILRETITPARWVGVVLGFAGVLIACRPGRFHPGFAALLALLAAALWAAATVLVRKVSLAAGSSLQMFYSNWVFASVAAVGTALTWRSVPIRDWVLLLLVGVLGGAGQLCYFEAMRRAPASVLAPYEYTALLWAFTLGYVLWDDVPSLAVFVGAAVIVASGCIVFAFERRTSPVLADS
jgi:drug/metabolite transporter (DMT)-like permease